MWHKQKQEELMWHTKIYTILTAYLVETEARLTVKLIETAAIR
jgi:hypothetical protein